MIVTIKIRFSTGCSTIIVVQRERYLEHQLTTYCNITVGKKWKNGSLWSNVTFWWVTTDIYGWLLSSMCLSIIIFLRSISIIAPFSNFSQHCVKLSASARQVYCKLKIICHILSSSSIPCLITQTSPNHTPLPI